MPTLRQIRVKISHPVTGALAKGVVTFHQPYPLRDSTGQVLYGVASTPVRLDGVTIPTVGLVPNNLAGISPGGWAYAVTIDTDVLTDRYQILVPAGDSTLQFVDLVPVDTPPDAASYALLSQHLALQDQVEMLEEGSTGGGGGGATLPLFDVEAYGAVGDGTTDDYPAIREAWDAMLASPTGGLLFFPRAVTYRVAATLDRLGPTAGAYALFPMPLVSSEGPSKKTYGVQGVGAPYAVRAASSFGIEGDAQQVATATILSVDYADPFAWHATYGLPCVFGFPDADSTGHAEDNIVSNVHFYVDGLIVRQPGDPSLCGMNLELASTAHVRSIRFDVVPVLDNVPEPTHPTGAALLGPKSNNNVAIPIESFVAEGHYAGLPYTEHCDVGRAIVLRCKIAVHNRRQCSHFGYMGMLKLEQCPYQLAGYDPQGEAPNLGVVPWIGGTVVIAFVDVEHYAYEAREDNAAGVAWIYPPVHGCDIYAPAGGLSGSIRAYGRINSEPVPPTGIGVAPTGAGSDIYLLGNIDGGLGLSGFGLYNLAGEPIGSGQRHLGTAPSNPPSAPPDVPTIGVATAGVASALVAFTPAGTGQAAASFTATSSPDGITATGASSPITVNGLTPGQAYTFTVHATNAAGSSAESAASNSVTPTGGATEYRLFPSETGPSSSVTDGAPINLGHEFKVTAAADATKLHFYRGNLDVTGPITGRLFEITGVGTGTPVAGSDVTFTLSGTGWQTVEFAAPITLNPAVRYAAVIHYPGRFVLTANYWSSGGGASGIVNGVLTAFNSTDAVNGQGILSSGSLDNYPAAGSVSAANYWVDVTVIEA